MQFEHFRINDGYRVHKIERPALVSGSRIRGKEGFYTKYGKYQAISEADQRLLREKLLKQHRLKSDSGISIPVIILIVILFMLGVGAYALLNLWGVVGIAILAAVLAAIFVAERKIFRNAILYGRLSLYDYEIQRKVILESYDNEISDDYFIVIGGAYVQINRKLYYNMMVGEIVEVVVIEYDKTQYFILLD